MGSNEALSEREREWINLGRQQGKSVACLAQELRRSPETVRKWWRRLRDEGPPGLRTRRRGRKRKGALSSFRLELRDEILDLKRTHPGWGARRILVELKRAERFKDLSLPSRSRLAAFFKAECPECVAQHQLRPRPSEHACQASAVHEIWQLDSQENIRLLDGEVATICSIRDPFGAAMLASRAISVKQGKAWRKLTWMEVRQILREAFTEWHTLPDSVWTDNEHGLAGNADDPYPSRLTLWLAGLGIRHVFIRPHCPTDQPHIERNHRTLDNLAINDAARIDLTTLQQALDREREVYNHLFPSLASDCAGRPPLEAHPALQHPRRPYQTEWEVRLFNLQQVYDFLSRIEPLERKVSPVGMVCLGRNRWSIGVQHAAKKVWATFDAKTVEWVFSLETEEGQIQKFKEIARRSPKGLDVPSLTGLVEPVHPSDPQPIQLTLPYLVP